MDKPEFRSREQERFHNLVARHIEVRDGPLLLEGGTGLGKTRAYLAAIASRPPDVARVAIVLPTHQLIDQLAASPDRAAAGLAVRPFRPARMFESHAEYRDHRSAAMESPVMICTAASVIIDRRLAGGYSGASRRDYLLFDEADQLPGAAALQQDLTITADDLDNAGVALGDVKETIAALLASADTEPEIHARARIIAEAIAEPAWFRKVGKDDKGGIALWHRMPGRLLKRISNRGNAAFVSATLTTAAGAGNFDDFRRSMGIGEPSRFSDVVEPKRHGHITVETPTDSDPADVVAQAERPCLVATPSFDDSDALGARLPGAVVREKGETVADAAGRVADDGVLIAAGAWAGLDTPRRWRSIVVPRIPFERPTILDDKIESRYLDSRNTATRRMRQVIGRGLRTPDAVCAIYICDERHARLGRFLPERFAERWREGGRVEVRLSKTERNRAVRRAALKHYGCRCIACGFAPPGDRTGVLHVHHLHPLREGERLTGIQDVTVLCLNCHWLAHTENPPVPLDRLRRMGPNGGAAAGASSGKAGRSTRRGASSPAS